MGHMNVKRLIQLWGGGMALLLVAFGAFVWFQPAKPSLT